MGRVLPAACETSADAGRGLFDKFCRWLRLLPDASAFGSQLRGLWSLAADFHDAESADDFGDGSGIVFIGIPVVCGLRHSDICPVRLKGVTDVFHEGDSNLPTPDPAR